MVTRDSGLSSGADILICKMVAERIPIRKPDWKLLKVLRKPCLGGHKIRKLYKEEVSSSVQ